MSLHYKKNIFSDYITSTIIINTKNQISYPIIIFYDQTILQSYYYALLVKNKILLNNNKRNVIIINLHGQYVQSDQTEQTEQSDQTEQSKQTNIFLDNLIKPLTNTNNKLNYFVIVDCLFDYANLIVILNNYNIYTLKNKLSIEIIPPFQIYFIVSCLNYYNINDDFMIKYYDYICLTNFINIYTENNEKYETDTAQSYKNLNQLELLKLIVNVNNVAIIQYIEIKNVYFTQKHQIFYKIYFQYFNNFNAISYINQWSKFDTSFIKFFNGIDIWNNIINYKTITDAIYIYNSNISNTTIGYLVKTYKISYIYNYNNKIFIDQYKILNENKLITFASNNKIITTDLSDSIYRINGTYFNLTYDLNFTLKMPTIVIKSINEEKYIQIIDITTFYTMVDIQENNEHFKLIVFSNFKYDKIDQIDIIKNTNYNNVYNDPFIVIKPMIDFNNYYLFFIIISKYQFRITRYAIVNNNLVIDCKMKINKFYNCAIQAPDYLSDLFFTPIEINTNILN